VCPVGLVDRVEGLVHLPQHLSHHRLTRPDLEIGHDQDLDVDPTHETGLGGPGGARSILPPYTKYIGFAEPNLGFSAASWRLGLSELSVNVRYKPLADQLSGGENLHKQHTYSEKGDCGRRVTESSCGVVGWRHGPHLTLLFGLTEARIWQR